jgi:hypothetical protein
MLMFFAAIAGVLAFMFGGAALAEMFAPSATAINQTFGALLAIGFMLCILVLAIAAAVERIERALQNSAAARLIAALDRAGATTAPQRQMPAAAD